MKRLADKDALAGLFFMAIAAWGFVASSDLEAGSSAAMGPGYFPRIVSGVILLLGAAIFVGALRKGGPLPVTGARLRPILCVSLAGLAFAVLLERVGIVAAISAAVLIGTMAGERLRLLPLLLLIVGLIVASIALFIWGIGVPMPIWPDLETLGRRWS